MVKYTEIETSKDEKINIIGGSITHSSSSNGYSYAPWRILNHHHHCRSYHLMTRRTRKQGPKASLSDQISNPKSHIPFLLIWLWWEGVESKGGTSQLFIFGHTHTEVPRPGIKPGPPQWPKPQQWQHQITREPREMSLVEGQVMGTSPDHTHDKCEAYDQVILSKRSSPGLPRAVNMLIRFGKIPGGGWSLFPLEEMENKLGSWENMFQFV